MKRIVDINQFPASEVARASELKAEGVWSLPGNSPGLTADNLRSVIAGIGGRVVVTEEGGMDVRQLLDEPNWTGGPRGINGQRKLTRDAGYNPSRAMVYYEFSPLGTSQTILTPDELKRAFELEGNTPLLPMTRDWSRSQRDRMKQALALPRRIVRGVTFEIEANVPLTQAQNIVAGIRYVHSVGREVWVLVSPKLPSVEYEKDVDTILKYLRRHLSKEIWAKLFIVLAVYELDRKGTSFFGEKNSMLAAVRVAGKHR